MGGFMKEFVCYHTDEILRKHQLLAEQRGEGDSASFKLVDWEIYKRASKARQDAFFAELDDK
jgi:hypothetical protein